MRSTSKLLFSVQLNRVIDSVIYWKDTEICPQGEHMKLTAPCFISDLYNTDSEVMRYRYFFILFSWAVTMRVKVP